ncbi:MAG: hypothetical protein WA731_05730 [Pseudonocardiaceae bacterium]|jgi:hypothetical protein
MASDLDQATCARIREGDAEAVDEVVTRDYNVADLLAHAAAGACGPGDTVTHAWTLLISDIAQGRITCGLRAALLARVITVLEDRNLLDDSEVAASKPYSFSPPQDDRWAGWWEIDPPTWPASVELTAAVVLRALRRVPIIPRIILVLRDAAKISVTDVESILQRDEPRQIALLDAAREEYVFAIDTQIATEKEMT